MRHKKYLLPLCLLIAAHLSAETILVNPNPIVIANAINDNLTGADLAGLAVVATYGEASGPLVIPMTWVATGTTSGSASASAPVVAVSLTGDAAGNFAWHYSSILLGPSYLARIRRYRRGNLL